MRVGFGDLTLWSFVMASAHGAGLMLVPFFLPSPAAGESHHHDAHQMHAWAFANFSAPSLLITAVVVHTLGYLLTTALVAIVVYEKLGVAILRRAWFNIDFVWMLALMITGVFILFLILERFDAVQSADTARSKWPPYPPFAALVGVLRTLA